MTAVDVVIPAHEKDFDVLMHAVRGVLRYVRPVGRIYVVSKRPFSWHHGPVEWVPESAAEGVVSADQVRARWSSERADVSRAAWLYQQLLKLAAPFYIEHLSPSYLHIDADVIFLREVSFAAAAPIRFLYSHAFEYHEAYREAYGRLFGEAPVVGFSLTGHHMLYDQGLLSELMGEVEQRQSKPWYDAYLDAVDYQEDSSISEMDIYGWWVLARHPELARHRQLVWRDTRVVPGPLGRAMLARDCHFVAAHAWMRQRRLVRAASSALQLTREVRADVSWRRKHLPLSQ
jgi:hypothetical protein